MSPPGAESAPDPTGHDSASTVVVTFDGAAQRTPIGQVAAYGFTADGPGRAHQEYGLAVAPDSPRATNNVAEYTGAIRALEWLTGSGFRGRVVVRGDSELVIRQMRGEYEVRTPHLREYHAHLQRLATQFESVSFEWIPRTQNQRADELSKAGILSAVRGSDDTGRPPAPGAASESARS
jgi:ribonuclease HI